MAAGWLSWTIYQAQWLRGTNYFCISLTVSIVCLVVTSIMFVWCLVLLFVPSKFGSPSFLIFCFGVQLIGAIIIFTCWIILCRQIKIDFSMNFKIQDVIGHSRNNRVIVTQFLRVFDFFRGTIFLAMACLNFVPLLSIYLSFSALPRGHF